jgi:hypothetical protein
MFGAGSGGSSSVGVVACLFSQFIVAWSNLPWARGSGCQSFNSLWCFTSAKHGSSISARSLIHRAHAVCVCVPIVILDPPVSDSVLQHNLFLRFPVENDCWFEVTNKRCWCPLQKSLLEGIVAPITWLILVASFLFLVISRFLR